jgi:hypothetical protein
MAYSHCADTASPEDEGFPPSLTETLEAVLKIPTGRRTAAIGVGRVALSRHILINMALSGALPTPISLVLGAHREF